MTESTRRPDERRDKNTRVAGGVLCSRYILEERLQQGRLGVVFRALDMQRSREEGIDRRVAVLILPSDVVSHPRQREVLQREFANVSALAHENLVPLYAFDADGDTHFIVMEWVDGESLRSVVDCLAPETLAQSEALEVIDSVGDALIYAHACGVAHGDVRPENVLIGSGGEIKLLLTPACLARAAPFPVDEREDVYGLAALAYELFSGGTPLSGGHGSNARSDEPARIRNLSRARWNALRAALAPRESRTRSVRQFLNAMELRKRKRPRRVTPVLADTPPTGEPRFDPMFAERNARPERRAATAREADREASRWGSVFRRGIVALAIMVLVLALVSVGLRLGPDGLKALVTNPTESPSPEEQVDRGTETLATDSEPTAEVEDPFLPADEPRVETFPVVRGTDAPEERGDAADADGVSSSPDEESSSGLEEVADATPRRSAPDDVGTDGALRSGGETSAATAPPEVGGRAEGAQTDGGSSAAPEADAADDALSPDAESSSPPVAQDAAEAATAAPRLALVRSEIVVNEGQSVVPIEVRRVSVDEPTSLVWWTKSGSATAPDDYADLGRAIEMFEPGQTTHTILVPITADARPEPDESFSVSISELSRAGMQRGELLTVTVTIVDDDS